nr:FxLYD domain-containing protein [Paenibacillus sp. NEAU-GSW1]
MQKAAEEDLINKTAAVELLHIETELDENGSLHINGQLKNAATRPIYSVTIEYTVHDSEGKPIESGTAKATPDFIEAGENFNFSAIVTGIEDPQVKVVVDHATWYLD